MKTFFYIFLLVFAVPGVMAQADINTRVEAGHNKSPELNTIEAKSIVYDIMNIVGLKPSFELYVANISNAAAVVTNGKRYIFYNPDFIQRLNEAGGNKWAAVSVLAHEIGHHLNGHTLKDNGSLPALELEADEFSGFIMRKMGATLEQAQAAIKIAADYKSSLTHPDKESRIISIAAGWHKAGGEIVQPALAKYNKPQSDSTHVARVPKNAEQAIPEALIDESNIAGSVYFAADTSGSYFLTTGNNLVKIQHGKIYMAGKLLTTTNKLYPFAIANVSGEAVKFLVDKKGRLLTLRGKAAGYIRSRDQK